MLTTQQVEHRLWLQALLGPEYVTRALTHAENTAIDAFMTRNGLHGLSAEEATAKLGIRAADQAIYRLVHAALNEDGTVRDQAAFAQLEAEATR